MLFSGTKTYFANDILVFEENQRTMFARIAEEKNKGLKFITIKALNPINQIN